MVKSQAKTCNILTNRNCNKSLNQFFIRLNSTERVLDEESEQVIL